MYAAQVKDVIERDSAASNGDAARLRVDDQILAQLAELNRQMQLLLLLLQQASGITI